MIEWDAIRQDLLGIICWMVGHKWFSIGYGTVRCSRCEVSGHQDYDGKVSNLRFDLPNHKRRSR